MTTAYISHALCSLHEMGPDHPESPARLDAINDQLVADGTLSLLLPREAPAATETQLARVHTHEYIQYLHSVSPRQGHYRLDPDTWMNPHSLDAAVHAAGAVVQGVESVMSGEAENAFCAIRPPGHHAEDDRAMGFCLFNNVAVAAAHALEHFGLDRVAIVDFDVHHGNGTVKAFREDPRVLVCDIFQHPFYPNTPLDTEHPNILEVLLPAGTYSEDFRQAVEARVLPAVDKFAPQLMLVSAGFDGHYEDDLAQMNLLEDDYFWITRELVRLAARHCNGRIVSTLEGGYNLHALGRSVAAHIRALLQIGGQVKSI